MDLFGLISTKSLGGKSYVFVLVDDYSWYTWIEFLNHKDEAFEKFETFALKLEWEKTGKIYTIRSDHGGEFESNKFASFYESQGITHTFSVPRTPQQNRVGERKNRALIELTWTIL